MENIYNLVVLVRNRDVLDSLKFCDEYFKFLPIKKIVFLGNGHGEVVGFPYSEKLSYINGEDIIKYDDIEYLIEKRNENAKNRAGWYLQQFLKLSYAFYCEDKYYIVWDSDSLPLKKIEFFEDGKPIFRMTEEFNKPYFDTMEKMIPFLHKVKEKSFVSNHMIYDVELVKRMIWDIEDNKEIEGERYYEKIINSIAPVSLPCGFSEFETYGTYVSIKYPNYYRTHDICTDRYASRYFADEIIDERTKVWISKDYHIVCFEKWCKYNPILHSIVTSEFIQKRYSAKTVIGNICKMRKYRYMIKEKVKDILRPIYRKMKGINK